jgi:hypothetical protein
MMSGALEQLGEVQSGEALSRLLVLAIAARNRRGSSIAYPDPYHSIEDVLLHGAGEESSIGTDRFDGRAYMLHVGIEWVARRLWRSYLRRIWEPITHVHFLEFRPSSPSQYLASEDDDGDLTTQFAGQPESWQALLARSRSLDRTELPDILWAHREMMPYLPLLFPYRFTPTLAKAIDLIASDPKA